MGLRREDGTRQRVGLVDEAKRELIRRKDKKIREDCRDTDLQMHKDAQVCWSRVSHTPLRPAETTGRRATQSDG